MYNSSNNSGLFLNNKNKQNQGSFKELEMYKTYFNHNNKNDIYNFQINTQFGSQRANYKSQNKNNGIIYEEAEYNNDYHSSQKNKNFGIKFNNNNNVKIKKNNYGINSYSTYGNLGNYGKKNNKVTLPNLGFGKKGY